MTSEEYVEELRRNGVKLIKSEVSAPAVRTLLLKNHQHSAECRWFGTKLFLLLSDIQI